MFKRRHLYIIYFLVGAMALLSLRLGFYSAPILKRGSNIDVLFIGDSITFGWRLYPEILVNKLSGNITVAGIRGLDTMGLHKLLLPTPEYMVENSIPWWVPISFLPLNSPYNKMHLALKKYNPEVIVLEIGVNNWSGAQLEIIDGKAVVYDKLRDHNGASVAYKKLRSYDGKSIAEIQEDAALGTINGKGVQQIIAQIKSLYGEQQKIILVGGAPTYFDAKPVKFDSMVSSIASDPNMFFASLGPLARVGWSYKDQEFYDYTGFPDSKKDFATTHVDWVHLSGAGYGIYAHILDCPIKKMLDSTSSTAHECKSYINAADLNAAHHVNNHR